MLGIRDSSELFRLHNEMVDVMEHYMEVLEKVRDFIGGGLEDLSDPERPSPAPPPRGRHLRLVK